ncbi:MAG: hypothetical protein IJX75_01705 [Clostridia bacterium]|nr:hypothetical protein [Clostridia bacterium]
MLTDFFRKKQFYQIALNLISIVFVVFSLIYAYTLTQIKSVYVGKSFYFLISESTHIEASAHFVSQNGGAGYLLEDKQRQYVAFSVYLNEEEGQSVLSSIKRKEEQTSLLALTSYNLYFKTRKEKARAEEVKGAVSSLYSCIEVLNKEIVRLDKGATQQSSKRLLGTLQRQFVFMEKKYRKSFPKFSQVCKDGAEQLIRIISDIVYVGDLRYLACALCVDFVDLTENFSL